MLYPLHINHFISASSVVPFSTFHWFRTDENKAIFEVKKGMKMIKHEIWASEQ